MARPKSLKPKHCRHKATNRGFVILNGDWHYTGPPGSWGTQAANDEYDRLIGQWIARGRTRPADPAANASVATPGAAGCSVKQVIAAYWLHCKVRYTRRDGTVRGELLNIRDAIKHLKRLFAEIPAADFNTRHLIELRRDMIRRDLCRNYINRTVGRIVAAFKWAMLNRLVPVMVHHELSQLPQLERDEDGVRETLPVPPVPEEMVKAVLDLLPGPVRAMVELQALTAARPGELRTLRTRDVDRSDSKVWAARLVDHKMAHKGKSRVLFFGPQAQAILAPYLKPDRPDAYCFSPAEALAERHRKQRENRKTPVQPSQRQRAAEAKRRVRNRPPSDHYTKNSYGTAVVRACVVAFKMPKELRKPAKRPKTAAPAAEHEAWKAAELKRRVEAREWRRQHTWSPNRLRHNAATFLERKYGLEPASKVLGHDTPDTTRIYAQQDFERARQIMAEVG